MPKSDSSSDQPRHSLDFSGNVSVAERTAACRAFLRLQTDFIRAAHQKGARGLETAFAGAGAVDIMLSHLFEYAIGTWEAAQGKLPSPVTLVALGGYGRAELSPHSDIDIMFLFPSKVKPSLVKPLQEHMTNEILYPLWDCGLKVGHSTRTIDEVFVEAKTEIQSKTALLECRRVAGSKQLFETFTAAYRRYYTQEDPSDYITARLKDQAARREKHGGTVFLQEPDIKNGVGGLRDYQNTLWMARVKFDVTKVEDLIEQGCLSKTELSRLRDAYDFLLRVRTERHLSSKRPTDLLDLEVQPAVALGLGYTDENIMHRVEKFMRDYYRAAQTIYRSSQLVEKQLALSIDTGPTAKVSFVEAIRARRYERVKRIDDFIIRRQELSSDVRNVFQANPARLVRVFRHAQRFGATLSFDLQAEIREQVDLIDESVRTSADANAAFKAILEETGAVFPALNQMHELGVLGKFIPEFDRLTCLVQHEFYHRYTADIHTLNTIRELDAIFSDDEETRKRYCGVLRETGEPNLLYLILLLHDIGKAHGIKDHAKAGVQIAMPILERLNVSRPHREIVAFIIENHLLMARFWQTRDVDDPATAVSFATQVSEPDLLRYLYVHTFCDSRGTAAGLWTSYKDALHSQLYRATLDCLIHGDDLKQRHADRLKMTHEELLQRELPGIDQEEVTAHFNLLPDRYFLNTDQTEIALHLGMVNRLLKTIANTSSVGSLQPMIEWREDLNRSLTVVHVVTWDRAGLFSKLAGAFSVAGMSVVTAKVFSREDHIAIDTFYVMEDPDSRVKKPDRQKRFNEALNQALLQNRDLMSDIESNSRSPFSKNGYNREAGRAEIVRASFPPRVDIYHEISMERTIVEVQAEDQVGLLFLLTRVISEHNFDITFARVGTERHVAIDTFYIIDVSNAPVSDPLRLQNLKTALLDVITRTETPA